jgi:Probable metal-binding protein (DUF2387).
LQISYLCPNCNQIMQSIFLASYPPIPYYECLHCGYRSKRERQESEQAEPLPQHLRTDLESDSTKTATIQEKEKSYWVVDKFRTWATCGNCGESLRLESGVVLFDCLPNYCINCGCRMKNGGEKF